MSDPESKQKTRLRKNIARAISGDQAAIDLLKVPRLQFTRQKVITRKFLAADYNTYATRMLSCAKVGNYFLEQASKHMLSYIANYSILWYNEDVPRSATLLKEDKMLKEMEHLAEVPFSRPVDDAVTSSEEEHEEERQEEECQEECQEEHQEEVDSAKSSASSQAGPAPKRRKGERSQESYVAKEKSSHNKNRKCQIPGCKYYSPNLPQHLKVHINKGEVVPEDAK